MGLAVDGANRHDMKLVRATVDSLLRFHKNAGLVTVDAGRPAQGAGKPPPQLRPSTVRCEAA